MNRPYICVIYFMALFLASAAGWAIGEAESEDGDYSVEAIGSGRITGAALRFPDIPDLFPVEDEWLLAAVARLIIEGKLGPRMDYEVNFYTEISRVPSGFLGGAFATAGSFESPYRYKHLSWDFWEDGSGAGRLGLDRLVLNLQVQPVSISFGRMPVNYSVTRIFTPNDFFAPFSATAINTIYKPGVDALRVGVATGMLSSLEMVGVMGYKGGDVPAWSKSALMARASAVLWNFEWALLGGKLAERWIAGASIQGEAGPVGLRSEGHIGFPDRDTSDDLAPSDYRNDDIYGRVAAGLDIMFTWHRASVGAEYMFMSDGAVDPLEYLDRVSGFFPDDNIYLGKHYVGASAGMDLIPILRLNAVCLLNALDLSGITALTLAYNIDDEIDLLVGAMIPWGDRPTVTAPLPDLAFDLNSEYGAMPFMDFLETRFYF
jgi:hypothetical protein